MNRDTCRWMIGEARKLSTALRETMAQLTLEKDKPCRCTLEDLKAENPCSPCLAREATKEPED